MKKLEREIRQFKHHRGQGLLFENQVYMDELERSIDMKEEELHRRRTHYDEIRKQLASERKRITKILLPRQYNMNDEAQIFPVAVEIRLPMPKGGVS